MSPFRRIAPTAAPPRVSALAAGAWGIVAPGACRGRLDREIATVYPDRRVRTFATGRAALERAIRLAMAKTGRSRVVLPAFTSFSVAAAAARAGARVVLGDVDPRTLDFDRERLAAVIDERVAAVVLGNLFGYPSVTSDLDWVRSLGVVIVDDAAQALGASEGAQPVGGRGDIGVLSFGRGKCVTTGDAGAVLVGHDWDVSEGTTEPLARGMKEWAMAAAARVSTSATIFGGLSRLPGVGIGESHYDPDYARGPAAGSAHGLAADLRSIIVEQRAIRTRVADAWMAALRRMDGVVVPKAAPGTKASYLRVPILAVDSAHRDAVLAGLVRARFAYARSYPCSLAQIDAFQDALCEQADVPGADALADRGVALPCHAGVRPADIERAARAVATASRGIGAGAPPRTNVLSPS